MILKKLICLTLLCFIFSCHKKIDYYQYPTYSDNEQINAVIEIPAGTNKKFEFNNETQTFEIDKINGKERIIEFLPYIGNYGFIPSTYSSPKKGGDGDALDVLVLSESIVTGTIIKIIPIGVLKLIDNDELDYKIIAVPTDKNKRIIKADSYSKFSKNYPEVKRIIEIWFLNYNKNDPAKIEGWGNEIEAIKEINKSYVNED